MAVFRAVIYCRCSTEEESQVDALRNQAAEAEACVIKQGWSLADRYIESKSGTTTKGRDEYKRLLEDLLLDKFDIIVIKSQDRLMRNVKDWYLFLDRMICQGKRLFMYLEGKFYSPDDALITGIKAILAEEYSRELSKKINNAHRQRQLHGDKVMLTSRAFGFQKEKDGSVRILQEEADIIRQFYQYCAAGYGSRTIANIFRNQGYRKRTGGTITPAFVLKVIRNPLYKGTMVSNRRHIDFETKRTIRLPESEWIYRKDAVPGIVDDDLWKRANEELDKRAKAGRKDGSYPRGSNPGKYELSGKLICAECGMPYYRTWRKCSATGHPDQVTIEWKCSSYVACGRKGKRKRKCLCGMSQEFESGCNNIHLNEEIVYSLLEQVSLEYYGICISDQQAILESMMWILKKVLNRIQADREYRGYEAEEERLIRQKELLLTKLLEGVVSDTDYQKRNRQLEAQLNDIRMKEDARKQNGRETGTAGERLMKLRERLEHGGVEKAAVVHMLREIACIKVHEWQLEICFDSVRASLFVDYPFPAETERGRYLMRRRILSYIKEHPDTTVKEMAEFMGRSRYMVRRRVEELKKGEYLCFHGKGGRGSWKVLKDFPDMKERLS